MYTARKMSSAPGNLNFSVFASGLLERPQCAFDACAGLYCFPASAKSED